MKYSNDDDDDDNDDDKHENENDKTAVKLNWENIYIEFEFFDLYLDRVELHNNILTTSRSSNIVVVVSE